MNEITKTSGIPSARRKLERARFHLEALHDEVRAFRDDSPYKFTTRTLGNPVGEPDFRIIVKVVEATPVPEIWALITGDVLTNARAALDHAIYPHVRAIAPAVKPWRIQYPIEDTESGFEIKAAWFTEDVRQVIEDRQPYKVDDPLHALRMLRDLVNVDKHRDLVLANYSTDEFYVPPQNDLDEVVSTKVYITEMVPGAIVARAHLRSAKLIQGELVDVRSYMEYGEHIEVPGYADPAGLLPTMDYIVAPISQHLDALEQAGC